MKTRLTLLAQLTQISLLSHFSVARLCACVIVMLPAFYAALLVSSSSGFPSNVSVSTSSVVPRTLVFGHMCYRWACVVGYWLISLMIAYAIFMGAMMTVLGRNPKVYRIVMDGAAFPLAKSNALGHMIIFLFPLVFAAAVCIWTPPKKFTASTASQTMQRLVIMMYAMFAACFLATIGLSAVI